MRRLLPIALVAGSLVAVTGCGSSSSAGDVSTSTPSSTTTPVTVGTSTTATSEANAENPCGTFTAPGETARRTTWRVYARGVPCRIGYRVVVDFNRTGRAAPGWKCTGEDVQTRCSRGAGSVRAITTE